MDPAKTSTCTTCTFAEDMSNYWTASLYFKSPENGSYRRVPQMANFGLTQDGGITVYYMQPFGGSAKVTSFKPVRASSCFSAVAPSYSPPPQGPPPG